jgi:hypothetical protein
MERKGEKSNHLAEVNLVPDLSQGEIGHLLLLLLSSIKLVLQCLRFFLTKKGICISRLRHFIINFKQIVCKLNIEKKTASSTTICLINLIYSQVKLNRIMPAIYFLIHSIIKRLRTYSLKYLK